VKLFVEERMEQWNKHGFNVDGWGQVFKVFKQHISTMNTKCCLASPLPSAPQGCMVVQYRVFSL
jgi:hypothetical protein